MTDDEALDDLATFLMEVELRDTPAVREGAARASLVLREAAQRLRDLEAREAALRGLQEVLRRRISQELARELQDVVSQLSEAETE